jgi:Arc/MetJ-type ribon-helix-helix transcriptional regulator
MEVDLTPEHSAVIGHAMATGRIQDLSQAVQEAMDLWVARERRRVELLASLDAADASLARGEGIEISAEAMAALSHDVMDRCRARIEAEQSAAG